MSNQEESPVTQLLRQLIPMIDRRDMARGVTWRYPEYPKVVAEAKARMLAEEIAIEDCVRTWVEKQGPRKIRSDDDDVPDA
jgi:hypothetical protein